MKGLGKAAIVLTILFFVFLIPAGILIALGAVQANNDYDVQGTLQNIVGEMDNYNHIGSFSDSSDIQFSATYTPSGDISGIVIENAAFELDIVHSDSNEFVVEHDGNYPYSLISKYGIVSGDSYDFSGDSPIADLADDGGDASPFFFREENGVLTFGLETGVNVGSGNLITIGKTPSSGKVTVYLPASYKGDFTVNKCAGEISIEDLELNALSITNAAGEFDAIGCKLGSLKVAGIAGELEFEGSVGSMDLSGGMGDYDITLTAPLTDASSIVGTMGDVNITMPAGSKLKVTSGGTLGEVYIDSDLRDDSGVPFNINGNLGEFIVKVK